MNVKPEPADQPPTTVSIVLPQRLHDAMKELARRRRVMLGPLYELALEHFLSNFSDDRKEDMVSKRVNLSIDRGIHAKAREVSTLSALYEVAAIQYLTLPENYLGENYGEFAHDSIENNKRAEKGKARPSKDNRRRNRQAGKSR